MYSAHRVYRRGQKPGNLVKAVEGDLPPGPHEGRELPTTHRVVIYAMVITCSGVLPSAAVAAAANPLRLPWNSSFARLPLPPFSLFLLHTYTHFVVFSPSYTFLHAFVLFLDDDGALPV